MIDLIARARKDNVLVERDRLQVWQQQIEIRRRYSRKKAVSSCAAGRHRAHPEVGHPRASPLGGQNGDFTRSSNLLFRGTALKFNTLDCALNKELRTRARELKRLLPHRRN
ncbi:hypothetical protein [Bradyrhizobium tropiciagri]|uniref:hypothetical protein n=1 Tax=Bradyrhizobium tropiciagri TaxID=312253 RepID=UPI001FCCC51C|nr:hypothetical protein [Bradyrhizobium tropiciagri]